MHARSINTNDRNQTVGMADDYAVHHMEATSATMPSHDIWDDMIDREDPAAAAADGRDGPACYRIGRRLLIIVCVALVVAAAAGAFALLILLLRENAVAGVVTLAAMLALITVVGVCLRSRDTTLSYQNTVS